MEIQELLESFTSVFHDDKGATGVHRAPGIHRKIRSVPELVTAIKSAYMGSLGFDNISPPVVLVTKGVVEAYTRQRKTASRGFLARLLPLCRLLLFVLTGPGLAIMRKTDTPCGRCVVLGHSTTRSPAEILPG